jgi:hypothetical protein
MDLEVPVPLLEDLHAAAAAGSDVHFDVCSVYTGPDGFGCTCGVPALLRSLAELLPLPLDAAHPYKPAWAPTGAASIQ